MRVDYAIVFVSDMKKSVAFYRDAVGLTLRFESPNWSEFATEGATLALHASEVAADAGPERSPAGRCRPGFSVPDLDGCHRRLIEMGVTCVQEPKEVFGARLAHYFDPDGLLFTISEARRGR